jgi:hypothetical protein
MPLDGPILSIRGMKLWQIALRKEQDTRALPMVRDLFSGAGFEGKRPGRRCLAASFFVPLDWGLTGDLLQEEKGSYQVVTARAAVCRPMCLLWTARCRPESAHEQLLLANRSTPIPR